MSRLPQANKLAVSVSIPQHHTTQGSFCLLSLDTSFLDHKPNCPIKGQLALKDGRVCGLLNI
jgi:hypothetical protein